MVSSANADFVQLSVMKGIVEEKRVKWSDYAPIMVNKLPFYIKAEVGAPVRQPLYPYIYFSKCEG